MFSSEGFCGEVGFNWSPIFGATPLNMSIILSINYVLKPVITQCLYGGYILDLLEEPPGSLEKNLDRNLKSVIGILEI